MYLYVFSQLISDKPQLDIDEPELFELEREEAHREPVIDIDIAAANAATPDINDDEDDDMASPLNPDAVEFIPTSPQRENTYSNGGQLHDLIMEDKLISQSPRKNGAPPMEEEDLELPLEGDFSEIATRPADVATPTSDIGNGNGLASPNGDHVARPGSSSSQSSYQEMNLKERMHGDEKQELAEEILDIESNGDHAVAPMTGVISENDVMNASFYGNENNNPFDTNAEVDMNAVQPLPDDSSEENENFAFDGVKPHIDNLLDAQFASYGNGPREGALENGQHYAIQDTEFGMNQSESETATPVEEEKHILQHIEQVANGVGELHIDTYEQQQQQEQQQQHEQHEPLSASISEVVHELASQVTSVLNDFPAEDAPLSPEPQAMDTASVASEQSQVEEFTASPTPLSQPILIDEHVETVEAVHDVIGNGFAASEPITDLDVPIEVVPEPAPIEVVPESAPIEVVPEPETNTEAIAAGAVAAATALAAASVAVAAAKAASPKAATTTKKPEVKARTTTGSAASPLAKKPSTAAAPLKSARMSATAKPATSPIKSRLAPAKAPIEKKTTPTTSAPSTAARKPLTNGTSSLAKKTTTTVTKTSAAKPLVSAARTTTVARPASASTAAKPATARTSTATATKTSTLSARPASSTVPRVAATTR